MGGQQKDEASTTSGVSALGLRFYQPPGPWGHLSFLTRLYEFLKGGSALRIHLFIYLFIYS